METVSSSGSEAETRTIHRPKPRRDGALRNQDQAYHENLEVDTPRDSGRTGEMAKGANDEEQS